MLIRGILTFARKIAFSTVKNPYLILGLQITASSDEIKKSYRSIAQKYHPDKNPDPGAQKMFIEAKQAYQTLIDQDKRRQFDSQHGSTHTNDRGYGFDRNPFDEFKDDAFKDKTRTYHETFTSGSSRKKKGDNIIQQIKLSFLDSVKGANLEITFDKKSTCASCNGNKCKPGTAPTRCMSCGGSGSTIYRRGGIVMHLECQRCRGLGLVIKNPCLDCKATGLLVQRVNQNVTIPPGAENGHSLTLKEKGHQSQNGPSGDLVLKFVVEKHSKFRKVNEDIQTIEWITISQAALGFRKEIDTIWGKSELKISAGSQDGSKIMIRGEGIQGIRDRGNHIVVIRIQIPLVLTQKQKRIFQELASEEDPINQQEIKTNDRKERNEDDGVFEKIKNIFK